MHCRFSIPFYYINRLLQLLNSSSVDISESFKALNDIKYHLTVITCLIEQFEMLFPQKTWRKKPPNCRKPMICKKQTNFARNGTRFPRRSSIFDASSP